MQSLQLTEQRQRFHLEFLGRKLDREREQSTRGPPVSRSANRKTDWQCYDWFCEKDNIMFNLVYVLIHFISKNLNPISYVFGHNCVSIANLLEVYLVVLE